MPPFYNMEPFLLKKTVRGPLGIDYNHYIYVNDTLSDLLATSGLIDTFPAVGTIEETFVQACGRLQELAGDDLWLQIELPCHPDYFHVIRYKFPNSYSVLATSSYNILNTNVYELEESVQPVVKHAILANTSNYIGDNSLSSYATLYSSGTSYDITLVGFIFSFIVIPSSWVNLTDKVIVSEDRTRPLLLYVWYQNNRVSIGASRNWDFLTNNFPEDTVFDFDDYIGPPLPGDDPYTRGGESIEGGGTGDFDNSSDEIPVPEVPLLTVDNTGFISLYSPSVAQLKSLASYLWASTGLDLETFKRIFTDPISTILGLTIVPVIPPTGASNNVVLGNVDTGVSMPRISNQYVQFDCGTLNVNEFWGGYLDYSPYTSIEIYLPFIGTKPLNIDDIMGRSVHVVYNIDLLSGACCAFIESSGTVLYQFIGQCSCSVPVTGRDMTNLINGILSVVGAGAGTFVATGGNPGLSGASAIGALASNVTKSKPKVEKSGSLGSMGGMLGVRSPYLIITRPRQALPVAQNRYTGYPSFITCVLSELVGYTEVYKVHLGDIPATDAEKAEIETLLMNGVIL